MLASKIFLVLLSIEFVLVVVGIQIYFLTKTNDFIALGLAIATDSKEETWNSNISSVDSSVAPYIFIASEVVYNVFVVEPFHVVSKSRERSDLYPCRD
jgi:hypothetical protein